MAHLNTVRFPEELDYGVSYGPDFVTTVVMTEGGQESRNRVAARGKCSGDCAASLQTPEQYAILLKFFRSVAGRFHTWRFKDWTDYQCAITEGVLIGLSSNTFQLAKLYFTAVGFEERRHIQAPIAAGLVLELSGTPLLLTTDYTLDDATGIVTTTAPHAAADLAWSGEFDNVCRFDSDSMKGRFDKFEAVSWNQIQIKEVPL
jgi:uncharacterized protein (TIGR02217 family)